jgi:hypothetical protein
MNAGIHVIRLRRGNNVGWDEAQPNPSMGRHGDAGIVIPAYARFATSSDHEAKLHVRIKVALGCSPNARR